MRSHHFLELPSVHRQNNIDLLRAMAVTAVFIHHAQHVFGGTFPFFGEYGGQFGPQLFFLISGYLITASWDKYSWHEYLCHRFFRIMPAYLLFFLGFGILQHVVTVQRVAENPGYFLANLMLVQQLVPLALITFDVLHVTWTLTVELMWYASVPLFALLLTRHPRTTLVTTTVVSTVWAILANKGLLNPMFPSVLHNPNWIYLFAANHFLAQMCFFLFGAWVCRNRSKLKDIHPLSALLAGLLVFLLRPYYFVVNPMFVTGIGLMCFLITAVNLAEMKNRLVMLLSETSYSIYLCHFPILLLMGERFPQSVIGLMFATAATLLLSFVTYKLVEKPGMQIGRACAARWKPGLATA